MRVLALLFLLDILADVAIAQTAIECRSLRKAADRLACFDKAGPPPPLSKLEGSPTESSSTTPGQKKVMDMLADENEKLDAKIKTICRGC